MRGYIILFFILSNASFSSAQTFTEQCLTDNEYNDRYGSYHPNGKLILFESDRSGNWDVYLMDENGTNTIQLTYDLASDRRPTWHPEGDKILFESNRKGEFELFELELASKKLKKIDITYDSTWIPIFARYSPDGNKIAVSLRKNESHAEIFVFDLKTGGKYRAC